MKQALPSRCLDPVLRVRVFPEYTDTDIQNRHTTPYRSPAWNATGFIRSWPKSGECFAAAGKNDIEQAMVRKVLAELETRNVATGELEKALAVLVEGKTPGGDPAWKELYLKACGARRKQRLKVFRNHPREFVYAKHFVFGDCQAMFAMTDHLTDAIFRECADYRMNAQLCKMRSTTIARSLPRCCWTARKVVRDPCVSYDGKRLAFYAPNQPRRRRRFPSVCHGLERQER